MKLDLWRLLLEFSHSLAWVLVDAIGFEFLRSARLLLWLPARIVNCLFTRTELRRVRRNAFLAIHCSFKLISFLLGFNINSFFSCRIQQFSLWLQFIVVVVLL